MPHRVSPKQLYQGVAAALFLLASACGSPPDAKGPKDTLGAYAEALEAGRTREAYDLLSDEAKKSLPFEAFQRMVKESPDEVRDIARSLARPAGDPVVTATVTAPSGETLELVYEDGKWRVDGTAIDLYNRDTPKKAVRAFVRAFERSRYDILISLVPEREVEEGLTAQKLKQHWEGEEREEMERLTQALKAALPTAEIEMLGDRATMAYGAGGTIELKLERDGWKIEDFR